MVTATGNKSGGAAAFGSDQVGDWRDASGIDATEATEATESTEATALLGAGAGSDDREHNGQPRKDSWVGFDDFEGLPWWKRPSVWWLLLPYSLFTLAFGGSLVPKLNLIMDLICNRYFADRSAADPTYVFHPVIPGADNPQCRLIPDVQKSVATFTLAMNVMVGILSSLTAPKFGSLSDRYGRIRLIVICSFGAIVGEIITILAAKYPNIIHYNWLILGAFFDGLTGSFTAGSVLSHSYTADCTPPSKRSVAIGYLHSCLFTGLAFGPLLAGYFVEWTGSLLSIFYVTLGCHIFFILFMILFTPESVSRKRMLLAREKYALEQAESNTPPAWAAGAADSSSFKKISNVLRSLRNRNPLAPLKILFPPGPANAKLRRNLITLAFVDMGLLGAAMGAGTVTVLYTEYIFDWGTIEASRFVSLTSMVRVVVLMGIFPVINYVFRTRKNARIRRESGGGPIVEKNAGADELDIWVLRLALLSDVVGVSGYIFARSSAVFVMCAVVAAFGGLGSATIQAALSKHVPAERVGELLGAIGLLHSLARVVSPLILNSLYAATIKTFPQAIFVLLAVIFGLGLAASFMARPHVFMKDDNEGPAPNGEQAGERQAAFEDAFEDEEILPGLR